MPVAVAKREIDVDKPARGKPAEKNCFFDQDRFLSGPCGLDCRSNSGDTSADDRNVITDCKIHVIHLYVKWIFSSSKKKIFHGGFFKNHSGKLQ